MSNSIEKPPPPPAEIKQQKPPAILAKAALRSKTKWFVTLQRKRNSMRKVPRG